MDLKHLLKLLRDSPHTGKYDWKEFSRIMKRPQGEIKNFIHIFAMKRKEGLGQVIPNGNFKKYLDDLVVTLKKLKVCQAVVNGLDNHVPVLAPERKCSGNNSGSLTTPKSG